MPKLGGLTPAKLNKKAVKKSAVKVPKGMSSKSIAKARGKAKAKKKIAALKKAVNPKDDDNEASTTATTKRGSVKNSVKDIFKGKDVKKSMIK